MRMPALGQEAGGFVPGFVAIGLGIAARQDVAFCVPGRAERSELTGALDAPHRADPLQGLLRDLRRRDRGVSSLLLPYRATIRDPQDASAIAWDEAGSWAAEGHRQSARVVSFFADGAGEWHHTVWDGAAARTAFGRATRGAPDQAPILGPPSIVISDDPLAYALALAHLPANLGLRISIQPWSDYLESMHDVVVLGRETVHGVDCLKVAFDMSTGPDDGEYAYPWLVWFDDERSFLSIRVQQFITPDEAARRLGDPSEVEALTTRFGDDPWVRYRSWDVLETLELDDGVWIPTRGSVGQPEAFGNPPVLVEVDRERVRFGVPLDEALFKVEPEGPAKVRDEVRGRESVVDPARPEQGDSFDDLEAGESHAWTVPLRRASVASDGWSFVSDSSWISVREQDEHRWVLQGTPPAP